MIGDDHAAGRSGSGEPGGAVAADGDAAGRRVAAASWHASLSGKIDTVTTNVEMPWRVVHLADTPADLRQPPLLDDIVCVHHGGAKEVERKRALHRTSHKVELGAITVMPSGHAAQWQTTGPIAYTHVVLGPRALNGVMVSEFDRERDQLTLADDVGLRDPLLEALLAEMIDGSLLAADGLRLYKEALFTAMVLRLFVRSGDFFGGAREKPGRGYASGGLAGWKLRLVIEFLHEHRAQDIGYEQLIGITGLSRAQFFRAFKQSLGVTPGRYLEQVRLDYAKRSLGAGAALEEAAGVGGFPTVQAMARAFRRYLGVSPSGYRGWYR